MKHKVLVALRTIIEKYVLEPLMALCLVLGTVYLLFLLTLLFPSESIQTTIMGFDMYTVLAFVEAIPCAKYVVNENEK